MISLQLLWTTLSSFSVEEIIFILTLIFILYSTGGDDGNRDAAKDVYMYDAVSNAWKDAGEMTTPRRGHSVALRDEDFDFYG